MSYENYRDRLVELMDAGHGATRIGKILNLPKSTVWDWMSKARIEELPDSPRREVIETMMDNGKDAVHIARAMKSSINPALAWEKKLNGEPFPIDRQLRDELARGTTYSKLKNRFNIEPDRIAELVSDVFDLEQMIVCEQSMPNGDTAVIVVKETSNSISWTKKKEDPKFKVFMSPEKNYMYVKLSDDLPDEIKIYNFTDLHIGSRHCRTELLKEHIKMVAEDPNALCVWGGDMFEFMHKMSVGQPWEQKIAPMEQVSVSGRMLHPISHKTIAYVSGNHDRDRGYKHVGADLAMTLAMLMGVSYAHVELVIDIEFKGNLFTMVLHHGAGSGATLNGIVGNAEKYIKDASYFVDWHMSGHVHNSQIIERERLTKIAGAGLKSKRFFTIIGGSYMKRTGTYAEETRYSPTPQDLTYAVLRADGSTDAGRVRINCE